MLAAELLGLPGDRGHALVTDVCGQLPEPAIDFVRLRIEARPH
jgi:hypothetical protein